MSAGITEDVFCRTELGRIALQQLGEVGAYFRIFEAEIIDELTVKVTG